jgi:DNA polymerase III epsilon subunit family exonuclease
VAVLEIAPSPNPQVPTATTRHVASESQRAAIEANPGPTLVLAGPGSGKTYCLIERIRFLIEQRGVDAKRICAFTFTNKAADEIASRLAHQIGDRAEGVKRRTIHAFCAELLREYCAHVQLARGFGIADEDYQLTVLRRLEGPKRWHRRLLGAFSTHRLRGDPLPPDDAILYMKYEQYLTKRNVVDFDTLVIKTAELLEQTDAVAEIRERWTELLVDEFQDLNPVQYRIIHALAREHRHVFAVGDDEQSIYGWAGADSSVFTSFMNDFGIKQPIYLQENRRCPREVFDLARRLIASNTPIFANREPPRADRASPFQVAAIDFASDDAEFAWIVGDIRQDRDLHAHPWGEIALLYRKHEIGDGLEAALLNAGISCRLARGRALADERVVAYVLAALRVIASPNDEIHREGFFAVSLPRSLLDEARAHAQARKHNLLKQLHHVASQLPRGDGRARQIRLALARYRNLEALGRAHATLQSLVRELLSQRVGASRSVLEDRHEDLTDPIVHEEVVRLAAKLQSARAFGHAIDIPRLGGVEIALKGMLVSCGFDVQLGRALYAEAHCLTPADAPSLGIALAVFKALQLLEIGEGTAPLRDFTVIDLETTGKEAASSEIIDIAAVRVRDGEIVEEFNSFVKPNAAIPAASSEIHGIHASDVATAPTFDSIWPAFREFCGEDIVVAHNGYDFDFRILARMVRALDQRFELCKYDTLPLARDLFPTSRRLPELARRFGIDTGRSHRALDDARTLAHVCLRLDDVKLSRARKTALVNLLDNLGVALALSDEASLGDEARVFRYISRSYALGRYSSCLETYERECGDDASLPSVNEVIDALGGVKLMLQIRSEKSADERYPATMRRLRRLIEHVPNGSLGEQILAFLERVALSAKTDGVDIDPDRVNLLTLHSTKGLEFSRVYVVGVEDGQLPGTSSSGETKPKEVEEARRLLYVGMTRAKERLVLSRVVSRGGKPTGGHRFLDEMGLTPKPPA